MLVLMFLLVLHGLLWAVHPRQRSALMSLSTAVVAYCVLWASIELGELSWLGQDTYGSDSEWYWQCMKQFLSESVPRDLPGEGYVRFGTWVLRTAPTQDFVWIVLACILAYSLAVNLLYSVVASRLANSRVPERRLRFAFLICVCNGILVWTVIRGLKETPLMLLLACVFYALHWFGETKRAFLKGMLLVGLIPLMAGLASIRPGSEYFLLPVLVGARMAHWFAHRSRTKQSTRCRSLLSCRVLLAGGLLLCLSGLFLIMMWPSLVNRIKIALIYGLESREASGEDLEISLGSGGMSGYGRASLRFLLGPGPFRSLQQVVLGGVFVASIKTGDVLILLGALQWWLTLALLTFWWLRRWKDTAFLWLTLDFLLVLVCHMGVYVYVYAGTGDTRHRAVMYFLTTPVFVCLNARPRAQPANREPTGPLSGLPRLAPSISAAGS